MGNVISGAASTTGTVAVGTWTLMLKLLIVGLHLVTLVATILLLMLAYNPNRTTGFYTTAKVFGIFSACMIGIGAVAVLGSWSQGKI